MSEVVATAPSPDEMLKALGDHIVAALPGKAMGFEIAYGELNIHAEAAAILDVLAFLRTD